jgi:hypothetical protein
LTYALCAAAAMSRTPQKRSYSLSSSCRTLVTRPRARRALIAANAAAAVLFLPWLPVFIRDTPTHRGRRRHGGGAGAVRRPRRAEPSGPSHRPTAARRSPTARRVCARLPLEPTTVVARRAVRLAEDGKLVRPALPVSFEGMVDVRRESARTANPPRRRNPQELAARLPARAGGEVRFLRGVSGVRVRFAASSTRVAHLHRRGRARVSFAPVSRIVLHDGRDWHARPPPVGARFARRDLRHGSWPGRRSHRGEGLPRPRNDPHPA